MTYNLRIGLMGSASTGKTTISRSLSNQLDLELHKELETNILKNLIQKGIIKNKLALSPDQSRQFQQRAIQLREKISKRNNYVTDRTAGELWVYHKKYCTSYSTQGELEIFKDRCLKVMQGYTHLFLFPYGQIPIEDNQWRNTDPRYQREIHTGIEEMLKDFEVPYVQLEEKPFTKEERLQEVLKWIRK